MFGFFVVVYSVFIHDFNGREIWSSICVILFRVSRHEKRQDKHSKWKLCWRSALFAVQQYTLSVSSLLLFKFSSFSLLCCLWIVNCYFLLPEEGEYFLQNQRKYMNSWGLQFFPVWVVWSLDLMLSFIDRLIALSLSLSLFIVSLELFEIVEESHSRGSCYFLSWSRVFVIPFQSDVWMSFSLCLPVKQRMVNINDDNSPETGRDHWTRSNCVRHEHNYRDRISLSLEVKEEGSCVGSLLLRHKKRRRDRHTFCWETSKIVCRMIFLSVFGVRGHLMTFVCVFTVVSFASKRHHVIIWVPLMILSHQPCHFLASMFSLNVRSLDLWQDVHFDSCVYDLVYMSWYRVKFSDCALHLIKMYRRVE